MDGSEEEAALPVADGLRPQGGEQGEAWDRMLEEVRSIWPETRTRPITGGVAVSSPFWLPNCDLGDVYIQSNGGFAVSDGGNAINEGVLMGLERAEARRVVGDVAAAFGFQVRHGAVWARVVDPDAMAESVAILALAVWQAARSLDRCVRSKRAGPSGNWLVMCRRGQGRVGRQPPRRARGGVVT